MNRHYEPETCCPGICQYVQLLNTGPYKYICRWCMHVDSGGLDFLIYCFTHAIWMHRHTTPLEARTVKATDRALSRGRPLYSPYRSTLILVHGTLFATSRIYSILNATFKKFKTGIKSSVRASILLGKYFIKLR